MPTKARFATAHRSAFPAIRTAEDLTPLTAPAESLSWIIGPSGELGPNGYRLPDRIWCAVGLYRDRAAAESALANPQASMPFLAEATESWHSLFQPTAHRGTCNHLDRANPTELFEFPAADPGGRPMVITTADFNPGPDFSVDRVIRFRRRVDSTNAWMATGQFPNKLNPILECTKDALLLRHQPILPRSSAYRAETAAKTAAIAEIHIKGGKVGRLTPNIG